MVESLRELNERCQKPRYREVGNWMVRRILRDAALPLTWVLLHTPVTANQVTLAALLTGLAGAVCLALPGPAAFLSGALLLQLWYYLDHVDGQLARYYQKASLSGRFFDFIMHHVIHAAVYFPMGLAVYLERGGIFWIVAGFVASLSVMMLNLLHDTRYKTFFERLEKDPRIRLRQRKTADDAKPEPAAGPAAGSRAAFVLHKSCEIHVTMNLLTAGALAGVFFEQVGDLRPLFTLWYAVVIVLLSTAKAAKWILAGKIDRDFAEWFDCDNETEGRP